jgi:predicted amidophosphoribosyltransferase
VPKFETLKEIVEGHEIHTLGPYRPWDYHLEHGGNGGDYPVHSHRIWDVKKNRARGLDYFGAHLVGRIKTPEVITVVPSHDPAAGITTGVHKLAKRLVHALDLTDGRNCLVRQKKIKKLSAGGDRGIHIHLNSIDVQQPELIQGRKILLLDDVKTTGHSLLACHQLLLDAGAKSVVIVALGRTAY